MGRTGPVRPSLKTLTSSAADFPVRTSASPERVLVLQAREAAYGSSSLDSLASFDPATQSWRTSQLSVLGGLEPYSETWPRSGMTRNGIAYQLPTLVPLTVETESGSWRTSTSEGQDAGGQDPNRSLHTQVRQWPTPTIKGNHNRKGLSSKSGDGLATAVNQAMWPTPTAQDADQAGSAKRPALTRAARCATSTARDFRHPGRSRLERAGGKQGENLPRQVGGALNPTWVEWLMGFPLGWTALEPSAMPSSRKSRKSSGEPS